MGYASWAVSGAGPRAGGPGADPDSAQGPVGQGSICLICALSREWPQWVGSRDRPSTSPSRQGDEGLARPSPPSDPEYDGF